ncbi:ATP-binding protein [bacterium]|nr:ATP-binding protein [bacterium]
MNWQELLNIYHQNTDPNTLECIPGNYSDTEIGQCITAMANCDGGTVLIGIDFRNFHLRGFSHDEQWVHQVIKTYCDPQPEVRIDTVPRGNKIIGIITVSKGENTPYMFDRKCYIRESGKTQLASIERERTLKKLGISNLPDPFDTLIPIQISSPEAVQTAIAQSQPALSTEVGYNTHLIPPISETPPPPPAPIAPPIQIPDAPAVSLDLPPQIEPITPVIQTPPSAPNIPEPAIFQVEQPVIEPIQPIFTPELTKMPEPTQKTRKKRRKKPDLSRYSINRRQKRAMTFIFKKGHIQNKEYRKLVNISHKTAHLELTALIQMNLLQTVGAGRSTKYCLSPQLEQVTNELNGIQTEVPIPAPAAPPAQPPVPTTPVTPTIPIPPIQTQTPIPPLPELFEPITIPIQSAPIHHDPLSEIPSITQAKTPPIKLPEQAQHSSPSPTLSDRFDSIKKEIDLDVITEDTDVNEDELETALMEIQYLMDDLIDNPNAGRPKAVPNIREEREAMERKQYVITYLKTHSMISDVQYAELLNIPVSTAIQELNTFANTGYLCQIIQDGRVFYQLASRQNATII